MSDLSPEKKAYIDGLSYNRLLDRWRNAPVGDPWFQGETGEYWRDRMVALKGSVDHVGVSKRIGWGK